MSASPEEVAGKLLARHGVTGAPVPVEEIAAAEGAEVIRHRHDGPEWGFILRDAVKGKVILGVNSNTSQRRQRGALAHALGHMLMHRDATGSLVVCHAARLGTRQLANVATDEQEAEASAFALELLMPGALFAAAVDEFAAGRPAGEVPAPRKELVDELARRFDAGSEAVTCRLITLGLLAA